MTIISTHHSEQVYTSNQSVKDHEVSKLKALQDRVNQLAHEIPQLKTELAAFEIDTKLKIDRLNKEEKKCVSRTPLNLNELNAKLAEKNQVMGNLDRKQSDLQGAQKEHDFLCQKIKEMTTLAKSNEQSSSDDSDTCDTGSEEETPNL